MQCCVVSVNYNACGSLGHSVGLRRADLCFSSWNVSRRMQTYIHIYSLDNVFANKWLADDVAADVSLFALKANGV